MTLSKWPKKSACFVIVSQDCTRKVHHKIKICITKWHFSSRKKNPNQTRCQQCQQSRRFSCDHFAPKEKRNREKKTLLLQCFVKLFANVHNLGAARKEESGPNLKICPRSTKRNANFRASTQWKVLARQRAFHLLDRLFSCLPRTSFQQCRHQNNYKGQGFPKSLNLKI